MGLRQSGAGVIKTIMYIIAGLTGVFCLALIVGMLLPAERTVQKRWISNISQRGLLEIVTDQTIVIDNPLI